MMSQPKITTFTNELLDKIFAKVDDKSSWLALIKTHRNFKASSQQLLFRDIHIPAQCIIGSEARCLLLLKALKAAPYLLDAVQTIQLDCRLVGAYPYGDLVLERDAIREIISKLSNLQSLTVFIPDQPSLSPEQTDAGSEIAQM
jgi:hypothetical protein